MKGNRHRKSITTTALGDIFMALACIFSYGLSNCTQCKWQDVAIRLLQGTQTTEWDLPDGIDSQSGAYEENGKHSKQEVAECLALGIISHLSSLKTKQRVTDTGLWLCNKKAERLLHPASVTILNIPLTAHSQTHPHIYLYLYLSTYLSLIHPHLHQHISGIVETHDQRSHPCHVVHIGEGDEGDGC